MAHEILASARSSNEPGRAGEVIVKRMTWDITAKSVNDTVEIGTLPAGTRIFIPGSQTMAKNTGTNLDAGTYSICISADGTGTTDQLVDSQAVVAATFVRAALSTYSLAETLGVSDTNRRISILIEAGFDLAGGQIVLDLAYFAP